MERTIGDAMKQTASGGLWRREIWLPVAFVLSGLAAFARVLPTGFLSDDYDLIGKVATGSVFSLLGEGYGGFFRPLTLLSHAANYAIFGFHPLGYHLTNVLFHGANAFLVCLLCQRLADMASLEPKASRPIALTSGFLFLVLPSHTEAVSWIAGRSHVIGTFFALISLWAFCSFLLSRSRFLLALCAVALSLALLTKENTLPTPFLLIIIGVLALSLSKDRRQDLPQVILIVVVSLLVLAGYLCMRYSVLGSLVGGYGAEVHLDFELSRIPRNTVIDLLRIFVPAVPPRLQSQIEGKWAFLLYGLGLGFLMASILRRGAKPDRPQLLLWFALLGCLLAALIPVLPMYVLVYSTEGERLLYYASAFGVILAAFLLHWFLSSRRVFVTLGAALVLLYALALQSTNARWVVASRLSEKLAESFRHEPLERKILFLNLPDNFHGGYVYRNGIVDAVSTFNGRPRPIGLVASTHDITSLEDEVVVREGKVGSLTLELMSPDAHFRTIQQYPGVEVQQEGPQEISIVLSLSHAEWDIFWYTRGQLVLLR